MNITQDFIDERFKAYVLETFCDNRESIETSDVDHIVLLQLANQQYSSLKGIELNISNNKRSTKHIMLGGSILSLY